jgi:hypothetical protein
MSTDPPDDTDDPTDEPRDTKDREDLLASLTTALMHIDASLDDLREGLGTVIQKLGALHSQGKRQEVALREISRSLDAGQAEEGSGAGF